MEKSGASLSIRRTYLGRKNRMLRIPVLLLVMMFLLGILSGCARTNESGKAKTEYSDESRGKVTAAEDPGESPEAPELKEYSDLKGKRVSMLTGAPFEELVRSKEPGVGEFTFFNNTPDMLLALESGKTDAVLTNNAIAVLAANRQPSLTLFPHNLNDGVFGLAFAKGDPLRDTWQTAYDTITEEEKQAAWEKWTGADESKKVLPLQDWAGEGGTIKAAVCDTLEPMSYTGEGGELIGFDIEMILMMAKKLDVHVEFTGMEFAAVMSAVQSGKAQIGAGSIIATEERRQSVDFVDYFPAAFVLLVRTAGAGEAITGSTDSEGNGAYASGGFLTSFKSSFEKTFLLEERWKLFAEGIGTTLLITVLSIIFGTVLGFLIFLLCRNGNPLANTITGCYVWLVQGMPVVVLLMILYYIVFGSVAISGVVVSVIGFTLVFGASVYGMLKTGVGAIDGGQLEAAYTLGYSDSRAFFRIILPQAYPHFMPTYKGEITSLIKATAIVGYIAVQDLTKMGDLIRSRTFEAFFPLIAVAVIYFLLAALIKFAVNGIERCIDPRKRKPETIRKEVEG